MRLTGILGVAFLFCFGVVFAQQEAVKTDGFGDAAVTNVLRVDAACRIYCDIADWPAIVGSEIPVQIRGLEPQAEFSVTVRAFILDTLNAALKAMDANSVLTSAVQLKNIQRGQTFCLIADIDVAGKDLGQMLIDKGYAKKLIVPNNPEPAVQTPPAASGPEKLKDSSSASAEGFIASKSGKVFHKPTCSHAKRIGDKTRVLYSTKDQALAAGRKPCQTCNP